MNSSDVARSTSMLKFLTHKLRTHSLNENNFIEKVCNASPCYQFTSVTSLKVTTRWKMAAPTAWNKGMSIPVPFLPAFLYFIGFKTVLAGGWDIFPGIYAGFSKIHSILSGWEAVFCRLKHGRLMCFHHVVIIPCFLTGRRGSRFRDRVRRRDRGSRFTSHRWVASFSVKLPYKHTTFTIAL